MPLLAISVQFLILVVLVPWEAGCVRKDSIVTSDVINLSVVGPGTDNDTRSKMNQRGFMWELVSSSSDIIPVLLDKNSSILEGLDIGAETESKKDNGMTSQRNVQMRLQKLHFYFKALHIEEEDCRLRLICEIAKDPPKYSPLSVAFLDEIRYNGDVNTLSSRLLVSDEGTQLLKYIEAAHRGNDQKDCEIWSYRCPMSTMSMINYQTLLIWREVSKWLTIQMVSKYMKP